MSIEKYMDLSTCYMTKEDNELLREHGNDRDCPIPAVYSYEEGDFVHCGDGSFQDSNDYPQELRDFGFSEAFINLLRYGADNGCWFLRLDADGDDSLDFPRFEW